MYHLGARVKDRRYVPFARRYVVAFRASLPFGDDQIRRGPLILGGHFNLGIGPDSSRSLKASVSQWLQLKLEGLTSLERAAPNRSRQSDRHSSVRLPPLRYIGVASANVEDLTSTHSRSFEHPWDMARLQSRTIGILPFASSLTKLLAGSASAGLEGLYFRLGI